MLCLGWIDNNSILTLSTIHTIDQANDIVFCLHKHPVGTSTNAVSAWKLFGNEARMLLGIPRVIDDYNHSMNAVDLADQFRKVYEVQRRARCNWWPLFYFFLDHAIINSLCISWHFDSLKNNIHKNFC